jgi:hypothetical protein
VERLEGMDYVPAELHAHAEQFSTASFQRQIDAVLTAAGAGKG